MMNTRVGRAKERNLRRDPRISFCIEDEYRYLFLRGNVELDTTSRTSQADIKALAVRYDGPRKAEKQSRDKYSKQKRVTIYMNIEEIGGEGV